MAEIVQSVKIGEKGDMMGIIKIVNDNKTNLNSCLPHFERAKRQ